VLERDLKGYKEYQNRVKYKMIPFIWWGDIYGFCVSIINTK
jgi:hypothetical protein